MIVISFCILFQKDLHENAELFSQYFNDIFIYICIQNSEQQYKYLYMHTNKLHPEHSQRPFDFKDLHLNIYVHVHLYVFLYICIQLKMDISLRVYIYIHQYFVQRTSARHYTIVVLGKLQGFGLFHLRSMGEFLKVFMLLSIQSLQPNDKVAPRFIHFYQTIKILYRWLKIKLIFSLSFCTKIVNFFNVLTINL